MTSRGNTLFVLQTQPLSSPEVPGWRRQSGVSPEEISPFSAGKKKQTKLTTLWQPGRHIAKNIIYIYFFFLANVLRRSGACSSFYFPARAFSGSGRKAKLHCEEEFLGNMIPASCSWCCGNEKSRARGRWRARAGGRLGGGQQPSVFLRTGSRQKIETAARTGIENLRFFICFAAGFAFSPP